MCKAADRFTEVVGVRNGIVEAGHWVLLDECGSSRRCARRSERVADVAVGTTTVRGDELLRQG